MGPPSWCGRITDQGICSSTKLTQIDKTSSPCTLTNSAILSIDYVSLIMYKWRKWHCKWSHSSWVTVFKLLVIFRSCGVLCTNCHKRVTQFWTHLKRKNKNIFWAVWWLSGSVLFAMLFHTTVSVVGCENTWRWKLHCYKGCRIWDFEICSYIAQSLHIDPTRFMLKPTFLPNGALHMLRNTNWFHNSVVLLSTTHNQLLTVS